MEDDEQRATIRRRTLVFVAHIVVVSLYLGLGGVCLQALEEPNEMSVREHHVRLVRDLLQQGNMSDDTQRALQNEGVCDFSFLEDDTFKKKWTLSGSTFFSLTVITTVGYGNQVPSTYNGKSFTTFYAIIGIGVVSQLLGSCAATLIGILRGIGQRLLKYMPCLRVCVGSGKGHGNTMIIGAVGSNTGTGSAFQPRGSGSDASTRAWGALWRQKVNRTGGTHVKELPDLINKLTETLTRENSGVDPVDEDDTLMQYVQTEADTLGDGTVSAPDLARVLALYYATAATLPKKRSAKNLLTLLSVCAVWACVWAFAFSVIEGWNYRNSLWFCVVTMSTIGFGDFTPETSAGRGMAYLFIITGLGLAATALGAVWEYFEARRFWLLQKHGSPKLIEAHEISVCLKKRRAAVPTPPAVELLPSGSGEEGRLSPLAEQIDYPESTFLNTTNPNVLIERRGLSVYSAQGGSRGDMALPADAFRGASENSIGDLDAASAHSVERDSQSPIRTPRIRSVAGGGGNNGGSSREESPRDPFPQLRPVRGLSQTQAIRMLDAGDGGGGGGGGLSVEGSSNALSRKKRHSSLRVAATTTRGESPTQPMLAATHSTRSISGSRGRGLRLPEATASKAGGSVATPLSSSEAEAADRSGTSQPPLPPAAQQTPPMPPPPYELKRNDSTVTDTPRQGAYFV